MGYRLLTQIHSKFVSVHGDSFYLRGREEYKEVKYTQNNKGGPDGPPFGLYLMEINSLAIVCRSK